MKVLNSSFSDKIAYYYDDFFLDGERVKTECEYILNHLRKYHIKNNCLADIGCGTGAHADYLSKYFDRIFAVDLNRDMLESARNNHKQHNIDYKIIDMRNEFIEVETDVALALSHVLGYQYTNDDVENFLINTNKSMKCGGVLLINYYYLAGIYLNRLSPRILKKKMSDGSIMTRISNAIVEPVSNCLNLDYYYILERDKDINHYEIHEKMRFFSLKEIEYFMYKCGFDILESFEYNINEYRPLNDNSWNAGIICRKEKDI